MTAMTQDKRERYAKVIAAISVDYLQGKTDWDLYIATLEAALDNIKKEEL